MVADHRTVGAVVDHNADHVESEGDALGVVSAGERRRHGLEAGALLAVDRPCGGMRLAAGGDPGEHELLAVAGYDVCRARRAALPAGYNLVPVAGEEPCRYPLGLMLGVDAYHCFASFGRAAPLAALCLGGCAVGARAQGDKRKRASA